MAETYIGYSPDVEVLGEDEERLTAEILEIMASTNRKAFERHRHAVRDAHAKSHGFLKGELVIPELPEHLRQGLFARPATYSVVIRLSSAPGDIHSDTIPAPRGMAIKVIGVAGERLLPEDQGRNQDFLLVNIPTLSFGTIGKYRQLIGLLEKNAQNPAVLQRAMAGVARGVEAAVEAVGVEPGATLRGLARDNDHLLGETYHSMAAIRFGDYIAKISAAPLSDNVRALAGKDVGAVEDATVAWHLIVRMRMFGSRLAFNLRTSSSAVANQLQVWAIPSWPGRAAKLLKKRGIPNLYFRRSDCEIIKVHLDVVARCFSS